MGKRLAKDWVDSGLNNEWYKVIEDLEARIRRIVVDSIDLTEGSGVGILIAGQYYYNRTNKRLYIRASDSGNPNSKIVYLFTYYWAWGEWATQAEMQNNNLFQIFEPQSDTYIKYVKVHIVKKNNPVFTDLKLEIHPELSNGPTEKILATSENVWTNSTINSLSNSASEIWFRFNDFAVKAGTKYCLVLKATGSQSSSQHFSWQKRDPIYNDSLANNMNIMQYGSLRFAIVGRYP